MRENRNDLIESLYRQNFQMLVVCAYRFLGDRESAYEAVQETFRIACEKIDDLQSSQSHVGWLRTATKNTCMNIIRKRQRNAALLISYANDQATWTEERWAAQDGTHILYQILSQEEILLLEKLFLYGLTYAEAAGELGVSLWACYKRAERATEKLQAYFKNNEK